MQNSCFFIHWPSSKITVSYTDYDVHLFRLHDYFICFNRRIPGSIEPYTINNPAQWNINAFNNTGIAQLFTDSSYFLIRNDNFTAFTNDTLRTCTVAKLVSSEQLVEMRRIENYRTWNLPQQRLPNVLFQFLIDEKRSPDQLKAFAFNRFVSWWHFSAKTDRDMRLCRYTKRSLFVFFWPDWHINFAPMIRVRNVSNVIIIFLRFIESRFNLNFFFCFDSEPLIICL